MGLISNGTTLLDAGALDSDVATGKMTLIKTLTASNSANLSFVHGASSVIFDGTYDSYVFKFIDIHPETDDAKLMVNFRDGGTAYDAPKTTNFYRAQHGENGSNGQQGYRTDDDLANSTAVQPLTMDIGNGNDESASGEMTIFNPSSTTFTKHFCATSSALYSGNFAMQSFAAGTINVTAAVDGVQFTMESGNFNGVIKLYGIGA